MKTLTGFPKEDPNYFLSRAIIDPSEALQAMAFDNVDYWLAKFKHNDEVQEDIAGHNFLKLVKHLRVVFLRVNIDNIFANFFYLLICVYRIQFS